MKRTYIVILGLIFSLISSPLVAGTLDQTLGSDRRATTFEPEELILKDPMIAGQMSASLPGLGQVYAGRRARGLFFFISTIGAFGATAAFAHPADLHLSDYDSLVYGGNGDGLMSTTELQNWEDGKFQDDAFEGLSTGRKVGTIMSAATGIGLYIWNIVDARSSSRTRNREVIQRRVELGLTASENQTGLALNLNF
ncbi:MAG: hypothetical protein VX910_04400 [Candidatus Latescibacterota bacterium]|nr:hypothetical protein [Candidatus Latescibacterota bacterium]